MLLLLKEGRVIEIREVGHRAQRLLNVELGEGGGGAGEQQVHGGGGRRQDWARGQRQEEVQFRGTPASRDTGSRTALHYGKKRGVITTNIVKSLFDTSNLPKITV